MVTPGMLLEALRALEKRPPMASDPMTLAEFRTKLHRLDLYADSGEAIDMEDAIWADVLRLLAGERERVVAEFRTIADQRKPDGRPLTGTDLQMRNALFLGVGVIRCMEDPT